MVNKSPQSKISRRSALGVLGVGTATVIGIGGITAATSSSIPEEDQEWFYQRTKEQYGAAEADIALEIVKGEYAKREKQNLSDEITYQNITSALLDHPDTPKGSADLRAVLEDLRLINDFDHSTNVSATSSEGGGGGGDVGTQGETCTDCGGSGDKYVIAVDSSEQETKDAYGSTTKAHTNVDNNNQRGYVMTGVYGAGHATTRLFGTYYVPSDGDYDVNAEYFRRTHVNGAQAKISIAVRPSYGGWNAEPVEILGAPREGSVTKTKTFTLNGGYYYDLGVELIAEGASSSTEGDISDTHNWASDTLRHLHVGELSIVQY